MHWSACAYAHADKCIYFKQVHMLTHAAYHFSSSVQRVIDQWQVSRALCNFGRKKTWCPWWHKVHMNQLENCQARYRSNTWIGRTRTDGPDEFKPPKFDIYNLVIISILFSYHQYCMKYLFKWHYSLIWLFMLGKNVHFNKYSAFTK